MPYSHSIKEEATRTNMGVNVFRLGTLVVLLNTIPVHAATYTVLIPPIYNDGFEAALIVAPGAEISGEAYQPLCVNIQKAASFKLWVAITSGYRSDTVDPISLKQAVYQAISDLETAGMDKTAPIFLAGHSLGGKCNLFDNSS